MRWRPGLQAALAGVAALGSVGAGALVGTSRAEAAAHARAPKARACAGDHWVAGWTASDQDSSVRTGPAQATQTQDHSAYVPTFDDQTLRLVVSPHAAGSEVRLRFTNRFGTRPVSLDGIYVGEAGPGGSVVAGTQAEARFGGADGVTLQPGQTVLSDPAPITVSAFRELSVSFHVVGTSALDEHPDAQQTSYLAPAGSGSLGSEVSGTAFTDTTRSWYALDALEVLASSSVEGIGVLGDSLTDGYQSSVDADRRWPDDLERVLISHDGAAAPSVLNAGIYGNDVSDSGSGLYGPAGDARLGVDLLSLPSLSSLIVFEGTNDLSALNPDADPSASGQVVEEIENAYRSIIFQGHAAGLKVIGATLTPRGGTGAQEVARQEVNAWIRQPGHFDGVADFDKAVRDPSDPSELLPAYDSGDGLHLNDAGYQALAEAVPYQQLSTGAC